MLLSNSKLDYKWFDEDMASYQAEQARQRTEYEAQRMAHMGEEFAQPYKSTKQELELLITSRISRVNRLNELKAPSIIVEAEQEVLGELLSKIRTGDYIVTPSEQIYRDKYIQHLEKFNFLFTLNVPEKYK